MVSMETMRVEVGVLGGRFRIRQCVKWPNAVS